MVEDFLQDVCVSRFRAAILLSPPYLALSSTTYLTHEANFHLFVQFGSVARPQVLHPLVLLPEEHTISRYSAREVGSWKGEAAHEAVRGESEGNEISDNCRTANGAIQAQASNSQFARR